MNKLTKVKQYLGKKISELIGKNGFEYFYNTGIDYFSKKDYENAINYFKSAISQKDVKPQVYYNLALSYQSIKNYDLAIVSYNKFLELNKNDYDGLYNLALTYYLKDNYTKSIEFFEKCVEIKKDEEGIKSLITAYLSDNEMQKAIDFAQGLLEMPNNGIKLYYFAAKAFENKNSFGREFIYLDYAIEMYSKIIEKDPMFFDAYISKSISYAKKGEWENSVSFCQKALDVNPKSYEANNQMGLVYYCCNELKEAIKYYEAAINLKPTGDYKIYSNLGYAYEKIGQKDRAIKTFTDLVGKFPQCPAKDEIKNHLRILKTL